MIYHLTALAFSELTKGSILGLWSSGFLPVFAPSEQNTKGAKTSLSPEPSARGLSLRGKMLGAVRGNYSLTGITFY